MFPLAPFPPLPSAYSQSTLRNPTDDSSDDSHEVSIPRRTSPIQVEFSSVKQSNTPVVFRVKYPLHGVQATPKEVKKPFAVLFLGSTPIVKTPKTPLHPVTNVSESR